VDPFETPAEGLFVTNLSPTHYLVLNKFPVIPDHFILATKEFKEQTDLLEEDDIGAAYACVSSYRKEGEELFGFFNSGPHSGASQPHRHIQFLPVESMRSGVGDGTPWNILADSLQRDQDGMDLPFTYFAATLPDGATPSQLHKIYTSLYEKAFKSAQQFAGSPGSSFYLLETIRDNESRISYNMGLTDRVMVLCPRVSEGLEVTSNRDEIIGTVALNGTVLGGTLLVKNEAEWRALRSDEPKLMDILKAIGIPSTKADYNERL
jgi:ATP adenylyltransferase